MLQGLNVVQNLARILNTLDPRCPGFEQEQVGHRGECALDGGRGNRFASLQRMDQQIRIRHCPTNPVQLADRLRRARQIRKELREVQTGWGKRVWDKRETSRDRRREVPGGRGSESARIQWPGSQLTAYFVVAFQP